MKLNTGIRKRLPAARLGWVRGERRTAPSQNRAHVKTRRCIHHCYELARALRGERGPSLRLSSPGLIKGSKWGKLGQLPSGARPAGRLVFALSNHARHWEHHPIDGGLPPCTL